MAKPQNLVVMGQDGKIAIIDCKGHIQCVENDKLGAKLVDLMEQRQKAGIAISKALEKAGYNVCASQESFMLEMVPSPKKRSRKK